MLEASEETETFYRRVIEEYKTTARLSQEELEWLLNTNSLSDVLDAVEKVRQGCEQKKKHRMTRFLERFTGGIVERLNRFSVAIETLVSSQAGIPALVWGSVKLVLMIYNDITDAFETMLTMVESLLLSLPRFEIYEKLFLVFPKVAHVLSRIYQDIIDFCFAATKIYKTSTTELVGRAIWNILGKDFTKFQLSIKTHTDELDRIALAEHIEAVHEFQNEQIKERVADLQFQSDVLEALKLMNICTSVRFTRDVKIWLSPEGKEPEYYEDRYKKLQNDRCPGTCNWLLDEPAFLDWIQPHSTDLVLWVHGGPGTGKSMLAASVIDHLRSNNFSVLFFFVDKTSNDSAETESLAVLRSLVFQLSESSRIPKNDLVQHAFEKSAQRHALRFDPLWELFLALLCLSANATTFIIVDGIDEFRDDGSLVPKLLELVSTQGYHIKLFFTSRATTGLCQMLDIYSSIEVTPLKTCNDMDLFISAMTNKVIGKHDSLKKDVNWIASALKETANGMYLCVVLQFKSIENHNVLTLDVIRKVVENPVSSMDSEYDKIFNKISQLSENDREISRHVFMWMTYALRPITLEEVETAFTIDWKTFGMKSSECSPIPEHNFLPNCGNLVILDKKKIWERGSVLRFIHASVKDYLLLKGCQLQSSPGRELQMPNLFVGELDGHNILAMTSLTYLCVIGVCLLVIYSGIDWIDAQNGANYHYLTWSQIDDFQLYNGPFYELPYAFIFWIRQAHQLKALHGSLEALRKYLNAFMSFGGFEVYLQFVLLHRGPGVESYTPLPTVEEICEGIAVINDWSLIQSQSYLKTRLLKMWLNVPIIDPSRLIIHVFTPYFPSALMVDAEGICQAAFTANALLDTSRPIAEHLPLCSGIYPIPGRCERILYLWDMAKEQIIAGEFSNEVSFFNLFITLWNCGQRDHAMSAIQTLFECHPDSLMGWTLLSVMLLSYGFGEKLIYLAEKYPRTSVHDYIQLARAHLALGNFNSSLECWKMAMKEVENQQLPVDSRIRFEMLAFQLGQEFLRFPHRILDEITGEDRDFQISNLFEVGARYIHRAATLVDNKPPMPDPPTIEHEMDFGSMTLSDASRDVLLAIMAVKDKSNSVLWDKWLDALVADLNIIENISLQRSASFFVVLAGAQLTDRKEAHLWRAHLATTGISNLVEMTRNHHSAVDIISTVILETQGLQGLQEYWDQLMRDHWLLLELFPWAERYGKLDLLFDRWRVHLSDTCRKSNQYESPFKKNLNTAFIISSSLTFCEAHFRRGDYLSVIIIIEQLLKAFGVFLPGHFPDTDIDALHDLLSTSYTMTLLTARAIQFKTYKPFTLSPIKWYTEFGGVYGYADDYSDGFDILGSSSDTHDLWNVANWRMKPLLECLVTHELYTDALDYCFKELSAYENGNDPFRESRILYYVANIQKISGEKYSAYQTAQDALQRFPPLDIVPEFRRLITSCWHELDANNRPHTTMPRYPHGYYFSLENEEYFNMFIDEEDVFQRWERFRDFRAIRMSSTNNILEIYRKQAEFHQFLIPPDLIARNDVSELADWMSGIVDGLAKDKKFPDWLEGGLPKDLDGEQEDSGVMVMGSVASDDEGKAEVEESVMEGRSVSEPALILRTYDKRL